MKMPFCRTDSLPMPERMPGTCGISEVSRQASELFQRHSCSRPLDPEIEYSSDTTVVSQIPIFSISKQIC